MASWVKNACFTRCARSENCGGTTTRTDSVTAPDSRAHCDTGGKQRRPIDSGEVADRKEHHHFTR